MTDPVEPFMRADHPNPAPRCLTRRASNGRQCVWHKELCDANEGHHDGTQSFSDAEAEPPDSASPSPNDVCQCGHTRLDHQEPEGSSAGQCDACYIYVGLRERPDVDWRHAFAPAEPETECQHENAYQITGDKLGRPGRRMGYVCEPCGEVWMVTAPRYCGADGSCRDPLKRCGLGCRRAADELSQQTQDMEPEAPETVNPLPSLEGMKPVGWTAEWADGVQPMSRRPPYAVAYAIEGGAQYEIALPGDASVRAEDGALIVTHDSAVLALSTVRPMEQ